MAKQVIWLHRAQEDRKMILGFWMKQNESKAYSKKLDHLFKEAIRLISIFPQIGKPADKENIRIKIVKNYLNIYEHTETTIYILAIGDSRQNPEKLEKLLK